MTRYPEIGSEAMLVDPEDPILRELEISIRSSGEGVVSEKHDSNHSFGTEKEEGDNRDWEDQYRDYRNGNS